MSRFLHSLRILITLARQPRAADSWGRATRSDYSAGVIQAAHVVAQLAAAAPAEAAVTLAEYLAAFNAWMPTSPSVLPIVGSEAAQLVHTSQLRGLHASACRLAHHLAGDEEAAAHADWLMVLSALDLSMRSVMRLHMRSSKGDLARLAHGRVSL